MAYPSFPVAGAVPGFLNPFDPSFRAASIGAIYGTVTQPVASIGLGAVIINAPWTVGGTASSPNPQTALFSWAYVGIVPPGNNIGTTPSNYWPQIVGPRRAYWATDPGGVPIPNIG